MYKDTLAQSVGFRYKLSSVSLRQRLAPYNLDSFRPVKLIE